MQNSHFQNQINVVIDGVEFDQAIFTSPETRNEAHAIPLKLTVIWNVIAYVTQIIQGP